MQVHDLPALLCFVQYDRSSIEEPRSIIEMEGRYRHVSKTLYSQLPRLNVHVRAAVLLPRICWNTVWKPFSNSDRPVARSGIARG